MSAEIGQRVAEMLPKGRTQKEFAADIGMTPDAFSRALSGQRGFAAIELAKIADRLGANLHFLITGEPDPNQVLAVARHTFDHDAKLHELPAVDEDVSHLEAVVLAYEQVQGDLPPSNIPASLSETRSLLGDGFVLPFANRLDAVGIDVVRLQELSAAYSLFIGDRAVIALRATGNWFWENWSLAHELGHIVLRAQSEPDSSYHLEESAANAFAAELLLPSELVQRTNWSSIQEGELAQMVWDFGVSTDALCRRLIKLQLPVQPTVRAWSTQPTQRLLRRHWASADHDDPITARMDSASSRRFPLALQEAHLNRIANGDLRKDTLAWMLGVAADALDVDEPTAGTSLSSDELSDILGL